MPRKELFIIRIVFGNGDVIIKEYTTRKGQHNEFKRLSEPNKKIFNRSIGYTGDFKVYKK